MRTIKNSRELAKLVNENKDLILPEEDVVIEFEPIREELRNVECRDLTLGKDGGRFNFNGRNFNGWDFNGWNFNGWDFNGRNFNGWDFNGWDFNGWDFNGKKVSYWAFFNCTGSIECESIEGRRTPHNPPVCLDGELKITKEEETIEVDGKKYNKAEVKERLEALTELN